MKVDPSRPLSSRRRRERHGDEVAVGCPRYCTSFPFFSRIWTALSVAGSVSALAVCVGKIGGNQRFRWLLKRERRRVRAIAQGLCLQTETEIEKRGSGDARNGDQVESGVDAFHQRGNQGQQLLALFCGLPGLDAPEQLVNGSREFLPARPPVSPPSRQAVCMTRNQCSVRNVRIAGFCGFDQCSAQPFLRVSSGGFTRFVLTDQLRIGLDTRLQRQIAFGDQWPRSRREAETGWCRVFRAWRGTSSAIRARLAQVG